MLTRERPSDLARKLEPVFAWPRAEVAERANRLLCQPLQRHDGLHQQMVGVGLAVVHPTRFTDIHATLCITQIAEIPGENCRLLVTILAIQLIHQWSHKFFQRVSHNQTVCGIRNQGKKLEVGLVPSAMALVKIGKAAEMLGVEVQTLRA